MTRTRLTLFYLAGYLIVAGLALLLVPTFALHGRIALAHRYQYCEDFPPKTVLLGAIAAAEG